MSPGLLVASVMLASYGLLSAIFSTAATAVWRAGVIDRDCPPPALYARRLVILRAFPTFAAALGTVVVLTPGYLAFEPPHDSEDTGLLLIALAIAAALLIAAGVVIAARAVVATWWLEQTWLRSSEAIEFSPPAGVPAYVVETLAPVVALVGVFSPKLVAARSVIAACTGDELARIVAHERGHLVARDNLKRWLMASAPDVLRWTPYHREIGEAWNNAAEDAADDAATAGDEMARTDLAALLVKIAGLSPTAPWSAATVSPFIENDGLDRRVRRLLEDEAAPARSVWPVLARVGFAATTILILAALSSSTALAAAHEIVERLVTFGR